VSNLSILLDKNTKIIVQGITSKYGRNQVLKMLEYGSDIVCGVSPGKEGETVLGIPVYDTAQTAVAEHGANAGIVYVPAMNAKDAALELIMTAKVKLIMIASEGIPLHDTMKIRQAASENGVWVVGPNTVGLISPGKCMMGSLSYEFTKPGNIGVVTRGGTVAIEISRILSEAGYGQSSVIGAGGDKVLGRNPADYLAEFEKDGETKAVVLNGEIGGNKEAECAEVVKKMKKPVFAYILGRCATEGKRMGHIGAIIGNQNEGFEAKRAILAKAGAIVVDTPWEIVDKFKEMGI
jgi:succinyl-CoA synthetase alpha subunit